MKPTTVYLIAGGAVLAALLYVGTRPKGWAASTGFAAGEGSWDLIDGVVGGFGQGAMGLLGIPKTNMSECERAKAEGRTWDASFACPAGTFIKYLWD